MATYDGFDEIRHPHACDHIEGGPFAVLVLAIAAADVEIFAVLKVKLSRRGPLGLNYSEAGRQLRQCYVIGSRRFDCRVNNPDIGVRVGPQEFGRATADRVITADAAANE